MSLVGRFAFIHLGILAACGSSEPRPAPPGASGPTAGTDIKPSPADSPAAPGRQDGPKGASVNPSPHKTGSAESGRDVFRFETFGNEGFWTDAMRLPQGMTAAKLTPLQALAAGLQIDAELLDAATQKALIAELKTDRSAKQAPMLNDPKMTIKLINARAVIGVVPVDTNRDGKLDVASGDKVGVACAICHTITDGSVLADLGGGSIGRRIDGPANLKLNMGSILAMAANSRAYYPNLQAELGGATHGRAPKGLVKTSTEAEVDAYLKNPAFYPVGTFDETSDGNGNPVKNTPLFRTDLAAPWGSSASFAVLDHIGNGSFTINLDQTTLVTETGRKLLKMKGGKAGEELADNYAFILKATKVKGYPFVTASAMAMGPSAPVGLRVDDKKLFDLNAYTDSLPAPAAPQVDVARATRGREMFRTDCTGCHNVDQGKHVPPMIVDMTTIFPGYAPVVIAQREPPMSPIQDSPGTFDDKMIVEDASDRGEKRGTPLPLLLDLARTTLFLHDASVTSLDQLLDPSRGAKAPHPFYVADPGRRVDMVEFLKSLDARPSGEQARR